MTKNQKDKAKTFIQFSSIKWRQVMKHMWLKIQKKYGNANPQESNSIVEKTVNIRS